MFDAHMVGLLNSPKKESFSMIVWRVLYVLFGVSQAAFCTPVFESISSKIEGLQIVGSSDPAFAGLVARILPDANDRIAIQPALPLSVCVQNTGQRSVTYFVVRFR